MDGQRPDPIEAQSATVLDDMLWGGPRYVENFTPDPIWVETKSEYRRLCALHGMENRVKHVPVPGTDKSPETVSWDIGCAPGKDPRPFALLSPEEQSIRRQEAALRLDCSVQALEALTANLETLR